MIRETAYTAIEPLPPSLDRFDLGQAHQEGWTLIEGCGPDGCETQIRGQDYSDHEARWRVARAARTGSIYHRDALHRLTDPERQAIELRFGPIEIPIL